MKVYVNENDDEENARDLGSSRERDEQLFVDAAVDDDDSNVIVAPTELSMQNPNDDGVGASLPHPEELKAATVVMSNHNKFTGSGISGITSNSSSSSSSLCRGRRMCYALAATFILLVVVVLSISIPVAKNNSTNGQINSQNISTNGTSSRNATLPEVVAFLIDSGVSMAKLLTTAGTPQYRAAEWIAEQDGADLKVPLETVHNRALAQEDEFYRRAFIVRYVMALNYFALGGPTTWVHKLNFLSNKTVCFWKGEPVRGGFLPELGVFCNNKTAAAADDVDIDGHSIAMDYSAPVELSLGNIQATGTLPTENGLLVSLTRLDVRTSAVTGSIPTELCQLSQLERLVLYENALTGTLPSCFGSSLTKLKHLYVNDNLLTGSVPTQLAALTQLERLVLEENQFTGNPVATWNALTNLQWLYADRNNFTGAGAIDSKFLSDHLKLEILDVSNNSFSLSADKASNVSLPEHLFSMPSLVDLDLSGNPLGGYVILPSNITNSKLKFLSLHDTKMTGNLPRGLEKLATLQYLDLSNNFFRGPLPDEYGSMPKLEFLFLSNNKKLDNGTIPTKWSALNKLQDMSLRNTRRQGAVPSFLGNNLTNLVLLDLGSNDFDSTIPAELGNLTRLDYLLLNGNLLTGGIESLSKLSNLKVLLLDGNLLSFSYPCTKKPKELFVSVDCFSEKPEVNCTCCKCCYNADPTGCSYPLLANLEGSLEAGFDRNHHTLFDD